MKDIVLIDGARTPFGTFGGALRDTSATELGVIAAKAALERSKVDPKQIDQVIFGNVLQTSGDAVYLARHIGLKAGVPKEAPALTINRLCGSGLQAILLAAQEIQLGQAEFVLAGGAENMSMAPHQIRGARWGLPLGEQKLEDYLWVALVDSYNGLGMANTAENLGRKYGITRDAADDFRYVAHFEGGVSRIDSLGGESQKKIFAGLGALRLEHRQKQLLGGSRISRAFQDHQLPRMKSRRDLLGRRGDE